MTTLPTFLNDLNDKQLEAVRYIAGPLLILAGAGTGKTRVIVSKITYIIDSAVASPNQILAVTFTNKAAAEMNERIYNNINFKLPWVGTFHSIAAKILRINAAKINLDNNFVILDSEDQLKIIRNLFDDNNIDKKETNPKVILGIIQQWKDQALNPNDISQSDVISPPHGLAKRLYPLYQNQLTQMDSVDFGDLVLKNIELFRKQPDILQYYQNVFKFIFVDEYQDTNTAQYLWLRMLSTENNKLCCVGDDDQSIYGWRGAKIGNILRFESDFSSAKVIRLEQNYRSNTDILNAASHIISYNKARYSKTLWTSDTETEKITVKSCWNDKEEAEFVANQIQRAAIRESLNYKNMAVLVRASFQTRAIEEILISHSIPYKIIGGLKFYERAEIKDAIAYLRLMVRKNDNLSLERIINKPKRGIGKTTLNKIRNFANTHHISLYQSISTMAQQKEFSSKLCSELTSFLNMVSSWEIKSQELSSSEMLDIIIKESGYYQMLKEEDTPESQTRIENILEFKQALSEYANLTDFLEHIALINDNDQINSDNLVNVMTLHSAKGLEFDLVFLPGWEEGLFPHSKSVEENGISGIEEERRLAYVGITRAKQKLFITFASMRRMYGQYIDSLPSRFIQELPKDALIELGLNNTNFSSNKHFKPTHKKTDISTTSSNRVSHSKFGSGFVIQSQGDLLEVNFDKVGIKKILNNYIKYI